MTRKIISVLLCVALLLTLSVNVSAEQRENLSGGQLLKKKALEDEFVYEDIELAEIQAENMATINATYLQKYIKSNETAKQTYGGCYIGDDHKLHILLTQNAKDSTIDNINLMMENSAKFESCKYSLDQLMALKECISDLWNNNTDSSVAYIMNYVESVGIDEMNNCVVVGVKSCNQEKINLFKTYVSNSDAIKFEKTKGYDFNATTMCAGSKIKIGTSNYSMGFRCRSLNSAGTYNNGFVTAAHGNSMGAGVYYNDEYIGIILKRSYANNGPLDASYVYIANSNYVASNQLLDGVGTLASGLYLTNYVANQSVGMVGAVTRYSTGKITQSSMNVNMNDGTTLRDLVVSSYSSQDGDSGGVVFANINSSKRIAGIHVMRAVNQQNFSLFVKASNIINNFDVGVY